MSMMMPEPAQQIQVPGGGFEMGGGGPGQPDTPDVESALRQALELLTQAQSQEQDDQDTLAIQKAMIAIQSVLGTRQKQNEAAMGTTPAHKAMGRAVRGA